MAYILIISIESDKSTSDVIEWLNYFDEEIVRLNYEDIFNLKKIELNSADTYFEFYNKNIIYNSNDVKSFWHRRNNIHINTSEKLSVKNTKLKQNVFNHLGEEIKSLTYAINFILQEKKHINLFKFVSANKIETLIFAKRCGLNIPDTLICNNIQELGSFKKHKGEIITKCIQEGAMFNLNFEKMTEIYGLYTTELDNNHFKSITKDFFYSKFQEKIKKAFELRIFILKTEVFSMAIFSQNNNRTTIDFRKYDKKTPNRKVPFKLPSKIKNKLLKLMKLLNLNSGSIDILVTTEGKYVFLEVNPVGQFDMVSYPCNYNIEKRIAEYLSH